MNKILRSLSLPRNLEQIIDFTEDIIYPYKGFDPRKLYRDNYTYKQALLSLENKDFATRISDTQFALTLRGKIELIKNHTNLKPRHFDYKKWDGKWRILSFDIPEKNRKQRSQLREYLYFLGFRSIQQSIWITPIKIDYDALRSLFDSKIQEKLLFIVTNDISEEKEVKELFQ